MHKHNIAYGMFKGSNITVCVLLDNNNTHTIMFDPDYNMMPQFFFHSNQYSAH